MIIPAPLRLGLGPTVAASISVDLAVDGRRDAGAQDAPGGDSNCTRGESVTAGSNTHPTFLAFNTCGMSSVPFGTSADSRITVTSLASALGVP